TVGAAVTFDGDALSVDGTLDNLGTLEVSGLVQMGVAAAVTNTGMTVLDGTVPQNLVTGGRNLGNLRVSNTTATVTTQQWGNLNVGTFTLDAGSSVNVTGNFDLTGGGSLANDGTLRLRGASANFGGAGTVTQSANLAFDSGTVTLVTGGKNLGNVSVAATVTA